MKPAEEERQEAIQSILRKRERNLSYYQANKERIRERNSQRKVEIAAYNRQYSQRNRERLAEYDRKYHQEHPEVRPALWRQYYREHKEEILRNRHRYNREHRVEILEYERRYFKEHPEVHKAAHHRRTALEIGADGSFTSEEFRFLCEAFGSVCAYCHGSLPLTPDHLVPLSRGGSNNIDNVIPACASCNSRKGTKTYDEYMEQLDGEAS